MMNQPYVDQSQSIHKYFGSGYERLPANGSENGVYDDISDFQFHFLCQDDFYLIKNKSFVPSMLWNKVGTFEYAKKGWELRISIVQSEFSSRNWSCPFLDQSREISFSLANPGKLIQFFKISFACQNHPTGKLFHQNFMIYSLFVKYRLMSQTVLLENSSVPGSFCQ